MSRIYFNAKATGSRHETNIYTFQHVLGTTYKWYLDNGIFSFNAPISEGRMNKTKPVAWQGVVVAEDGFISDERFGYLEIDDTLMAEAWKDANKLISKLEKASVCELETMTPNDAIAWIQNNTDYVEAPAWTFLIHEADLDAPGGAIEAEYLVIS